MTAILSMAKSDTLHKKKSPHIKEWMTQADPPKEASTFERMNDRSQLLSANGMRYYFKELKTASGVLTKIFCLGNRWAFEKIYSP